MGKPKHSDDTRGEQKGAQAQAEGQHGEKTRSAIKAGINNDGRRIETHSQREANDPNRGGKGSHDAEQHDRMIANPEFENDGRHRLFENRIQHDEAEADSEQNRRNSDVERHGHDEALLQGHTASERLGHQGARVKNTGEGGGNRANSDHGHS
ncbi:MAG TPA: hypothetical protein VGD56_19390 [Gemmatirosa sp.]